VTGTIATAAALACWLISLLVQMAGRWAARRSLRAVSYAVLAACSALTAWASLYLSLGRLAVVLAMMTVIGLAVPLGFAGYIAETRAIPLRDVLARCFPPKGGSGE
jgi:hypothetical protein